MKNRCTQLGNCNTTNGGETKDFCVLQKRRRVGTLGRDFWSVQCKRVDQIMGREFVPVTTHEYLLKYHSEIAK